MSTLLLRLAAPLQSWGASSKFTRRTTERNPTKSGVLGLICAAMGRRRDSPLDDLQNILFGVRIDQPGRIVRDYQTAHTFDGRHSFVSDRYYLADAVFLVGLEAGDQLLEEMEEAIENPVFPLSLGRRSCPPTGQLVLGIQKGVGLLEALDPVNAPWLASEWYRKKSREMSLEIVCDAAACDAVSGETKLDPDARYPMCDMPVSFDQVYRRYKVRDVCRISHPLSAEEGEVRRLCHEATTEHDPLRELEVE